MRAATTQTVGAFFRVWPVSDAGVHHRAPGATVRSLSAGLAPTRLPRRLAASVGAVVIQRAIAATLHAVVAVGHAPVVDGAVAAALYAIGTDILAIPTLAIAAAVGLVALDSMVSAAPASIFVALALPVPAIIVAILSPILSPDGLSGVARRDRRRQKDLDRAAG